MRTQTPSKDVKSIIRREVRTVFRELLSDPDEGLVLKDNFIKKLKKSIQDKERGRVASYKEIHKKYR